RRLIASETSSSACCTAFRGSSTNPVWIRFHLERKSLAMSSGKSGPCEPAAASLVVKRSSVVVTFIDCFSFLPRDELRATRQTGRGKRPWLSANPLSPPGLSRAVARWNAPLESSALPRDDRPTDPRHDAQSPTSDTLAPASRRRREHRRAG